MKTVKLSLLVIVCLVLLSACEKDNSSVKTISDYHKKEYQGENYYYDTDIVNFLFVGTDGKTQADAIFLLSLKRSASQARIYLIDRNTYTDIRSFDSNGNDLGFNTNYISLSYSYGSSVKQSVLLSKDAVSRLFGEIPISYYFCSDINDIYLLHSYVDELEIVLPNDSLKDIDESFAAGSLYLVTEENVEQYLRYRNMEEIGSNIQRLKRQEVYLRAYIDKIMEKDNIDSDKLMVILDRVYANIGLAEIEYYLDLFMDCSFELCYLPGENVRDRLRDRFLVDEEELEREIIEYYYVK